MNIRLKKDEQQKILCTKDIYTIMQKVLLRESKIDRNREHFWVVSLDTACRILNIELISMGTVNRVLVEPMEVFSVPLQKRAVQVILVHNHPSGELNPSTPDKDLTDRLIQSGLILHVPVMDHLIISEKKCYSFADSGLLAELEQSEKYVPPYKLKERIKQSGKAEKAREMALAMIANGESVVKIMEYTGLSKATIQRLKAEPKTKVKKSKK